jgi:hypothetical protein
MYTYVHIHIRICLRICVRILKRKHILIRYILYINIHIELFALFSCTWNRTGTVFRLHFWFRKPQMNTVPTGSGSGSATMKQRSIFWSKNDTPLPHFRKWYFPSDTLFFDAYRTHCFTILPCFAFTLLLSISLFFRFLSFSSLFSPFFYSPFSYFFPKLHQLMPLSPRGGGIFPNIHIDPWPEVKYLKHKFFQDIRKWKKYKEGRRGIFFSWHFLIFMEHFDNEEVWVRYDQGRWDIMQRLPQNEEALFVGEKMLCEHILTIWGALKWVGLQ